MIALFIRSILEEAGYTCDLYSSPHVISITERFVFSGKEISDDKLCDLLEEVEKINKGQSITFFEFLTSCFFLKASRSRSDISIVESGLFNRFDACSAIKQNLMSVISSIGLDHLEWLPENDRNVDRVIFEKTSKLFWAFRVPISSPQAKFLSFWTPEMVNSLYKIVFCHPKILKKIRLRRAILESAHDCIKCRFPSKVQIELVWHGFAKGPSFARWFP